MTATYFDRFNDHLLQDAKPSLYFYQLMGSMQFPTAPPFDMLIKLNDTPQNPKYHPEGNAFHHTMQVIDRAAFFSKNSKDSKVFMWTALLHDIGKGPTTQMRKGKLTSYNHDTQGAIMAKDFLNHFNQPDPFVDSVSKMIRWHMQPLFLSKNLPFSKLDAMVKEVSISELGLFSLCDRLGREPMPHDKQLEEYHEMIHFLEICLPKVKDSQEKKCMHEMITFLSSHAYT